MNDTKPSISIPVDVTNPGQFFACCGLLELAHRLWPGAEGWFADNTFHIALSDPIKNPIEATIQTLAESSFEPIKERGEEKTHPIKFQFQKWNITLDWWLSDEKKTNRFKLWAGQQSSEKIVHELQNAIQNNAQNEPDNLLLLTLPLSSRFGVDPQSAWNAIDVGFSPNEQTMKVDTFYIAEFLAAIGLQRYRPKEIKRNYLYYTWNQPTPAIVSCAVCNGALSSGSMQGYQFQIVTRGSFKGFSKANLYYGENS